MESQNDQDHQPLLEPIQDAREVGLFERAGALVMLGFGMSPLVVGWMFMWQRDFVLGDFIAVNVMGVFAFAVISSSTGLARPPSARWLQSSRSSSSTRFRQILK
jgi:hypothetical protein